MKLSINNFAKIKKADIIIDGITVIAGENNTGKSTVGKILFSFFNAMSDIESKIWEERLKEIEFTSRTILRNYAVHSDTPRSYAPGNIMTTARKIARRIKRTAEDGRALSEEPIRDIVESEIQMRGNASHPVNIEEWIEIIDELTTNISEILSLPEDAIILEVLSKYFNNVFHSQINPLTHNPELETLLQLEIKGKINQLLFANNECKTFNDEISLSHKAIYIDNPFIADELSGYNDLNPMNSLLKTILTEHNKDNVMEGIIETVRIKEKMSDIFQSLQTIIKGEIVVNSSNDEFYLKNDHLNEPISFHNLSTGMKSFVLLKMLLEKGCLKEKDIVVLDEPEIHLHPQWQIAYAELIVLLQKHFDLSVVVTTHSPYFVDAVHLFSCKYGIDTNVNYYLSSSIDNTVKMDLVTDQIDLIYQKMASPIQLLDTLRYELNHH